MRLLIFVGLLLAACTAEPPFDPALVEGDAGSGIRRDLVHVTVPLPMPAPDGTKTPAHLNQLTVVRYRLDTGKKPPKPAKAIVILMPGFLAGAGSFDGLARALVRRSAPGEVLEAWAVERRANALEDRLGEEAALDAGSGQPIVDYYFDGGVVAEQKFAGFLSQADAGFMSEWGLKMTEEDLRAVIALVPDADRVKRVVLAGHSLGGQIAAQYAAWDFGGTPGYTDLAGLVMIDAVTGGEGGVEYDGGVVISEQQYEVDGFDDPSGFGHVDSLATIRATNRFFELPILSSSLYVIGFDAALRARLNPDGLEVDAPRGYALQQLFLLNRLPAMTNRAAFGFAFDVHSCPLSIAGVNAGEAVGPEEEVASPFGGGMLARPSDPTVKYTWKDYDQVDPHEFTSLTDFSFAWTRGGVDFGEWYFPQRLNLDTFAAQSLVMQPADWAYANHGLRAQHGREIACPVMVVAAGLVQTATAYDALKAILPPVGAGRPQGGAQRSSVAGYEALEYPMLSHLDPLSGADVASSPVRDWYDHLASFAKRVTPSGGVVIP